MDYLHKETKLTNPVHYLEGNVCCQYSNNSLLTVLVINESINNIDIVISIDIDFFRKSISNYNSTTIKKRTHVEELDYHCTYPCPMAPLAGLTMNVFCRRFLLSSFT